MGLKIDVNEKAINDRLAKHMKSLLTTDTMLQIADVFAKMCDPYVPFLEGPLSQTVEVHPTYLHYVQPYASYQYYGTHFNHTLDYHPKATAHWDKVMMQEKGDEFFKQVQQILLEKDKNNG